MGSSCQNPDKTGLSESQIAKIKAEIKQAATDHLNAKDAATALSYYAQDVIAVSNETLFASLEELSKDVGAYYDALEHVDIAVWDEMHISVISHDTACVTAKFRYSFTDKNNQRTDLHGVWTALYVRKNGVWKIRVRHESFSTLGNAG